MQDEDKADVVSVFLNYKVPLGEEGYPCVIVAAAVVRRAFQDLSIRGEHGWQHLRRDAYEFLTDELWKPECLWRDILGEMFSKDVVLRAIHAVVKRMPDGRIVVINKR